MIKLSNGWHVPENEIKITDMVKNDAVMSDPRYEGVVRNRILDILDNKRTFVDVGANIGIWSLPAIRHFKKVVSYEPSKRNLECLKANIPTGIDLRERAIANITGMAEFKEAKSNCGDSKLCRPGIESSYSVPVVRLDDEPLEDVDLIKIDVQGWELEVLEGAKKLISDQHPWIVFEINQNVDVCCELLEKLDYDSVRIKSKRMLLFAPKQGRNTPSNKSVWGRNLGPGPYKDRFYKKG